MSARLGCRAVARLGAAYFVAMVAMLIATDIDSDVAIAASLCLAFALVTAAVGAAVVDARPFEPPRRRAGAILASTPAALVAIGAATALAGFEVGLGLLWLGLMVALVVIAWTTWLHGTPASIAAAGLGWWVVCGGVVAWASVSTLVDPSGARNGDGLADSGDALAVYLALFAFASLTALTAALQAVVLTASRTKAGRGPGA